MGILKTKGLVVGRRQRPSMVGNMQRKQILRFFHQLQHASKGKRQYDSLII
jgi:hypothetical protein